jgi:maltose/moltooligosaccharide transporter
MKLNYSRTILIGLAFLSIQLFWGFYEAVISKMLVDSFGLNPFWSNFVMTFDNLLGLFLLPFFGTLSDRSKSKLGKRTPFITIGIIIAAIFIVGVAIVDFYQQSAVVDTGILGIVVENNQYYFATESSLRDAIINIATTNGRAFTVINDVVYFTTKLDASFVRYTLIFNQVTLISPIYLILYILTLFLALIAMSFYRTPAVSLMPDITPKPFRSIANAIINLMGVVGYIIATLIINAATQEFTPYIRAFLMLALTLIAILLLFRFIVKEVAWVKQMHEDSLANGFETKEEIDDVKSNVSAPLKPEYRRSFWLIMASVFLWFFSFNAVTTKFTDYASNVLEIANYVLPVTVANIAALIGFLPLAALANRIGRKKTVLLGILMLSLGTFVGSLLTVETSWMIYVIMPIAGLGFAAINVNSYPMIVEMASGSNIGKYTGYYYTASMAAQIFTPLLSGALMTAFGLRLLFPYATVFALLSFGTMFFVKHGEANKIPSKASGHELR